ncbi:hypothetical protein DL89DRAFT_141190 [Linderina pennispora]|uniref:FYVE zinc finger domain-containing protein n=1 Tax=Linderina pennispora TaxID=61395 RepID=A0A1Y1WBY0_9FUNG|nr:uncharacterized protein DL89DRAFT_141190 [Linderina pennispora]ORX70828.1 hypothetical protein DL89DRAFT_141190 [Linderina pennispora]
MRQCLPESAWEPDEATATCRQDGRRFTLFLRRHHCRRCGLGFLRRVLCPARAARIARLARWLLRRVCRLSAASASVWRRLVLAAARASAYAMPAPRPSAQPRPSTTRSCRCQPCHTTQGPSRAPIRSLGPPRTTCRGISRPTAIAGAAAHRVSASVRYATRTGSLCGSIWCACLARAGRKCRSAISANASKMHRLACRAPARTTAPSRPSCRVAALAS